MTDPDPIPLAYSGPPTGAGLPRPAITPREPVAAAVGLVIWTVGMAGLVGLPTAVGILAFLGPAAGFGPLVVLVVVVPLLAAAGRTAWDRLRDRWVRPADRRRSGGGEAVDVLATGSAWAVFAGVYVGVPFFVLLWVAGPALAVPGVVALVLAVVAAGLAARAVRRRRAVAVLGYLEQAVRLNQPLDRLVAAAAAGEQGVTRRRLEGLYLALHGGMSTADAVAAAVPEVSAGAVGGLAYGESTGRLAAALRRAVEDGRRATVRGLDGRANEGRAFAAWYPPVMLAVLVLILATVGTFVVPTFVRIFRDFHVALPPITLAIFAPFAVDPGSWGGWGLYLLPVLAAVLAALLGRQMRYVLQGDRPAWVLRGAWARVQWHLPGLRRLHRDRNLADLCDALADAVGHGLPLAAAVAGAHQLGLNPTLLRQASAWAGGLDAGVDPATAARSAGLPPLVAGLVVTGDPADAAGGLRFAARFYAGRHAARRAVLAAAYVPAVTAVFGVVVGVVAVALVLPMRDLIDRMLPFQVGL